MKAEKIMNALGNIDEKYLEESAPEETVRFRNSPKNRRPLFLYAALAAACIGVFFLFLANANRGGLILTAYALEGGSLSSEQQMQAGERRPVTVLEADDGTFGFLFSVDGEDASTIVGVLLTGGATLESHAVKRMTDIHDLTPGRVYYYIAGTSEKDMQEVTLYHYQTVSKKARHIRVRIEKEGGKYFAQWDEMGLGE